MRNDTVAVVLPPSEAFSPVAAGAIGLLAHRLAVQPSEFHPLVLGPPVAAPFPDVPFRPACPRWLLGGSAARYAGGVIRALGNVPPALVEVHNRPAVALALAERLDVPVLLVLHNDPQGMRGARTPKERRHLLECLAGIATVSDYLRSRLLAGVAAPTRPVAVLPNCIDLSAMPPPAPREPVILFAGRMVADKGADVFVEACARALPTLPGWRAEMIGADRFSPDSPDTPFVRALRPAAAAAGVTLAGYRPQAEVLAAMAQAAVVAVPSRWQEPFGLTALEAMACGAALVTSPRGGLPEVAGDVALYADPDAPGALAAALCALAEDLPGRAARGMAGIVRAAGFGAPAARARLADIRADLLDRWSARP